MSLLALTAFRLPRLRSAIRDLSWSIWKMESRYHISYPLDRAFLSSGLGAAVRAPVHSCGGIISWRGAYQRLDPSLRSQWHCGAGSGGGPQEHSSSGIVSWLRINSKVLVQKEADVAFDMCQKLNIDLVLPELIQFLKDRQAERENPQLWGRLWVNFVGWASSITHRS